MRALAVGQGAPLSVLAGLLTNPDARTGRKGVLTPTAASLAASELSARLEAEGRPAIPQLKPERLDEAARSAVKALNCDLLVSFAYGRIFGPKFLALFPEGGVNVHPSLLPRFRGPSPIQAAILAGDTRSGVTVQRIAAQMDAGAILASEGITLDARETAVTLADKAAALAGALLPECVERLATQALTEREQVGESVYCHVITKEDGALDFHRPAIEIDRRIRALTPEQLCYTQAAGRVLYILEGTPFAGELPDEWQDAPVGTVLGTEQGLLIRTGDGAFAASALQWQTKKALDWRAFLNGARFLLGMVLDNNVKKV
jgi:methionyl-tRNA formyltransferase